MSIFCVLQYVKFIFNLNGRVELTWYMLARYGKQDVIIFFYPPIMSQGGFGRVLYHGLMFHGELLNIVLGGTLVTTLYSLSWI